MTEGKNQKQRFWTVLFFVFLFLLIFCLGFLIFRYLDTRKRAEIYEELSSESIETETEVKRETAAETTEPVQETEEEPEIPVDFEALWEINKDIYAWIEIPDTPVAYPIVQSPSDDSYYLDHTIEGESGYPGSIYTESLNSRDFTDGNTLVYGHNMRDDTMFGSLNEYADRAYMEEHPFIFVYTPEKILRYRIFAAITYDDRHILKSYDFTDRDQYQACLDSLYSRRAMGSCILEEVSVSPEDRLLTLSTCVGDGKNNKRFLVEAVLTDES